MRFKQIAVMAICGVMLAGFAMAEEEVGERPVWLPSLEASFDHSSRYMSEGNVGNPDPVNNLSLTAEWGIGDNFAIHVGGVSVIDDTDACGNRHNVEEWNWLAGFSFSIPDLPGIGTLEFKCDYIYYNYPHDKVHTHDVDNKEYEVDINAADLFLCPGIALVHDFENDVFKGNLNVTYEQKLAAIDERLSFECPVELWYGNRRYTGCTSHSAAYSLCAQPTLKYEINDHLSIGTYVLMGWALDSRVRRDWKEDENNNAFNACWGLTLTASF